MTCGAGKRWGQGRAWQRPVQCAMATGGARGPPVPPQRSEAASCCQWPGSRTLHTGDCTLEAQPCRVPRRERSARMLRLPATTTAVGCYDDCGCLATPATGTSARPAPALLPMGRSEHAVEQTASRSWRPRPSPTAPTAADTNRRTHRRPVAPDARVLLVQPVLPVLRLRQPQAAVLLAGGRSHQRARVRVRRGAARVSLSPGGCHHRVRRGRLAAD